MKRTALIFLIASLLLILGTATVFAAGQSQANPFTKITLSPEKPYPGQEVVGTIKHTVDLDGQNVEFEVLYEQAAEGELAVCKHNDCSFTATGQESKVHFYAPAKEGAYDLLLTFKVNEETHVLNSTMTVESALPEGFAQLFAGLGLFAAVMAIMAVGTEVVIETMKMFLGFKSKVTAMEAFDELKAELPGMLAGVGVDSDARAKVSKLVQDAGNIFDQIDDISGIYTNLKEGSFVAAYNALKDLRDNDDPANVKQLKEVAKSKIKEGVKQLQIKLNLNPNLTKTAEETILNLVDRFPEKITDEQIREVFEEIKYIFTNKDEVENWLQSQMDIYITQGEDGLNTFLAQAKEELHKLGFKQDKLDTWLDQAVVTVSHTARNQAHVYAQSVKKLLEEVEERRNLMQSPIRKLMRRLRGSDLRDGIFWAASLFVLPSSIIWGVFCIYPLDQLPEDTAWYIFWGLALLLGLIPGLIVLIVLAWAKIAAKNTSPEPKKNHPAKWTLGYVLRYYIERPFNRMIGHPASFEDAAKYGEVDSDLMEKVQNTSPTTIASTLLALENKHKDEETSRVRWMRIISIVVGIILAYNLKVDAGEYLNYIVPGIKQTINAIKLNNLRFVDHWFPNGLTVGMLLTGFAASAGSKFWRDFLARLQASRGQAEEAAQMVRKVKSTISDLS